MVTESCEICWASLMGKKIQNTEDRWKAEKQATIPLRKVLFTILFSFSHISFSCLSAFLLILLSACFLHFSWWEKWKNTNPTRKSIPEEKGVVRTLLYSQSVNVTSYPMVESRSLLVLFFFLTSKCVLQIIGIFHAVILNMGLFWIVAVYLYWSTEGG